MKTNNKNVLNYKLKDIRKVIRVIFQIILLTSIVGLFGRVVFSIEKYKEPDKSKWNGQQGFVTISFPGVSLIQQQSKITKVQLNEYLSILHRAGYVAISQQDIIDYYKKLKPLPEKAIFIIVDSGVKDSIEYIQPLLNKYQYIATCLTFAEKLEENDPYFIQLDDIIKMKKTGFWEFGSDGYRLTYINVFDENSIYYPFLNQNEFGSIDKVTKYNHYLMDFLRNEDGIPVETRGEMTNRINYDYKKMSQVYGDAFGFMPKLYVLMNSNSLYYGSNKLVGEVNLKNIENIFQINFNREGTCINTIDDSIYNLTYLKVEPSWYINHFLMRFKGDTKDTVEFTLGDKRRAANWDIIDGAAEFIGNRIVLTSQENKQGFIVLKNSSNFSNFSIDTIMSKGANGKGSIYLRYDKKTSSFINIILEGNTLSIEQKTPGSLESTLLFKKQLEEGKKDTPIKITLMDNNLRLTLKGESFIENVEIDKSIDSGMIALASEAIENKIGDKIYDSIFDDLYIYKEGITDKEDKILFDNRYSIRENIINAVKYYIGYIINWFIENL